MAHICSAVERRELKTFQVISNLRTRSNAIATTLIGRNPGGCNFLNVLKMTIYASSHKTNKAFLCIFCRAF